MTSEMLKLTSGADLYLSALTEFEMLSAIGRKRHAGELTISQYEFIRDGFYGNLGEIYIQQSFSENVFAVARKLLGVYKLRTLDAFQLASALVLESSSQIKLIFVTFDLDLADVAKKEGFVVITESEFALPV